MAKDRHAKPTNEEGKADIDELYDTIIYPRPEGAINLLSHSGNRQREVIIGGKDNDWESYCNGYRRAANALVNHITQKPAYLMRRDYSKYWESPAYAAIFLYRHYLELRLKELILSYGVSLEKINKEHSLMKLWEELRRQDSIQPEAFDDKTSIDVETAEKIIAQFNKIDEHSQAFRYPIDRVGQVTVSPIQFDLVQLKKMLGWTGQFLDAWSDGVYEYRNAQHYDVS